MSLVNISVIGNLVKSPEQVVFNSGRIKTVLIIGIKSPTKFKNDNMDFYKIEMWGRLAEIAHQYLSKGCQVGATGRLVLERWQDREGRDRITPLIKADQISLPPKSSNNSDNETNSSNEVVNPLSGQLAFNASEAESSTEEEYDSSELPVNLPVEMTACAGTNS